MRFDSRAHRRRRRGRACGRRPIRRRRRTYRRRRVRPPGQARVRRGQRRARAHRARRCAACRAGPADGRAVAVVAGRRRDRGRACGPAPTATPTPTCMPRRGSPDRGRPVRRRRAPGRGPARRRAHADLRAGVPGARLRPSRPHLAPIPDQRLVRHRRRARPARARRRLRAAAGRGGGGHRSAADAASPGRRAGGGVDRARARMSAVRFLQRHCDAASAVATEIRAAAQRCESLRDNLWHLVDVKVATAIAIDERTLAKRPAWLAAAAAVTTERGTGHGRGAGSASRSSPTWTTTFATIG